jgi:hypothetical protein
MQSYCLFHQESVATHRCRSCSKPLCDLCIQTYPEGVYCSTECHDKAAEASVRLAKIAEDEKALAEWKQRQLAYKLIAYCVIGLGLFFGWDHLPAAITDNVEKLWDAIKAFLKKTFP